MFWQRREQLPPEAYGPPAVVLDAGGVTAWRAGAVHSRILWSQIESVEIGVVTVPDMEYAEAFWLLVGEGVEFFAPVEIGVNAEQLTSCLLSLPGFDMESYRQAREAESKCQ